MPVMRRTRGRHRSARQVRRLAPAGTAHGRPRRRLRSMRDLTTRLREIVQRPTSEVTSEVGRSLSYVPDLGAPRVPVDEAAAALGGRVLDAQGSACIVIDRTWTPDQWHGRRAIEWYVPR